MVKRIDLPYVVHRQVKRRGKTYHYWYFEREGLERIRLPSPEDDTFLAKYQEAKAGKTPAPARFTFKKLIESYRTKSRTRDGKKKRMGYRDLAPRTQKDYDKALEYINRNIGPSDPRKMNRRDIIGMMDANDHRKKFANDLKQVLSILFEHARDLAWMKDNPAQGVQKFVTGKGYCEWPADVQEAFLRAADYNMRLTFILYLDTAQRGGDVRDLQWKHVGPEGISLTQNKTGKSVFIPFTDWLRDALDAERERQSSGEVRRIVSKSDYVLQGPDGGKLSYNTLSDRFNRTRTKAGIDRKYVLHGLRYTATAELNNAAGDLGKAVTGHQTDEMYRKYAGNSRQIENAREAQRLRDQARGKRE